MRPSKKLLGMPIVSLENGEQIGKVKGLILDPQGLNIAALVLEQKGVWFKEARVISFEHIKSAGEHAVTVGHTKYAERASALPQIMQLMKSGVGVIGAKVLTQDGSLLGTVEEFMFDPVTGRITSLEISGRLLDSLFKGKAYLPTEAIVTLGKHAIIVQEGAEQKLERSDSGLQETMKTVKEAGTKMWASTVETTKRLGEQLTKSVEKFTSDEEEETKPPQDKAELPGEASVQNAQNTEDGTNHPKTNA
ncbi:PRC-barrel domain-containing protein [Zhaonella formicivorans]|uniref:PRC-barrel domain-containing protein n=1 Tax=Zhaonella formicivorans TaxID=2528593 RepID=UPI0010D380EC|nr:PRC-barrel domain-containing protein [Zhaonella formicivorans]